METVDEETINSRLSYENNRLKEENQRLQKESKLLMEQVRVLNEYARDLWNLLPDNLLSFLKKYQKHTIDL